MRVLAATVFGVLIATVAGTTPRFHHEPPAAVAPGEPLAIELKAVGAPGAKAVMFVHGKGTRTFAQFELTPGANGVYTGEVPGAATRTGAVTYYIEVNDPNGQFGLGFGSSSQPIQVAMLAPAAAAPVASPTRAAFGGISFLLFGAMAYRLWQRRKMMQLVDRYFWMQTLLPFVALRNPELTRELKRVSEELLDHPRHGMRLFSVRHLKRRLAQVRRWDLRELQAEYREMARVTGLTLDMPRRPAPSPDADSEGEKQFVENPSKTDTCGRDEVGNRRGTVAAPTA